MVPGYHIKRKLVRPGLATVRYPEVQRRVFHPLGLSLQGDEGQVLRARAGCSGCHTACVWNDRRYEWPFVNVSGGAMLGI